MQDAQAFAVDKPDLVDTASVVDAAALSSEKALTDQALPADAITSFDAGKALTDTATPADAITAFNAGKALTDQALPADAITAFAQNKVLTDAATLADTAIFAQNKTLTDTATIADAISFAQNKALTDAATPADAITSFAQSKVLAHSVSVAENFTFELILGESFPIYDFAFISDDKFLYFPVPGTLNSHLIHEPLINGEFVLTTDPNAGIVYTIRTESESYMFAGYTLNGNQLN
jgi:hypothetical protein